jgi:hypothetical protein
MSPLLLRGRAWAAAPTLRAANPIAADKVTLRATGGVLVNKQLGFERAYLLTFKIDLQRTARAARM